MSIIIEESIFLRYCSKCDREESTTKPAKVWLCHNCKFVFESKQLINLLEELEISTGNIERIKTELSNRNVALSL